MARPDALDLAGDVGSSLLSLTPYPAVVVDSVGRVLEVNEPICVYFARTREELIGNDALAVPGISSSGRAAYRKMFETWLSGKTFPFLLGWPSERGDERILVLPNLVSYRGKPAIYSMLLPAVVVEAALRNRAADSARLARGWIRTLARHADGARPATRAGDPELELLTPREWEIARRIAEGDRVATLAEDLGISMNTVRNHLKPIFRKLGVSSQAELVRRVRRRAPRSSR